ncbi:phosphoadenosine phosphosulfate reductase family protein [Legionella cardiaca]|uniref:Phosphoadenosine phosphosulfate reductase family protein n=1 Tax=Legionella cardiaca TaxID=1071983 RepID=A0ABY8AP38_9GAMM|nr:phosphoadenosine phosphosulfate reductase family protein [Legionella cardiaca]WED42313.1 phosphoadenosine phosphosulfate reductase family protein [Legionella cardiaca]
MQVLIEKDLPNIHFIYVETGWAAASWPERVEACSQYIKQRGVTVHRLVAQTTFSDMVIARKQFPSQKFQWCASFLKGLTILNHLDDCDPACEALIVSGKRRLDSRRYADLEEFDYQNELYQRRTVWHPLWNVADAEFTRLINRTGFALLSHASLECSPCIHLKQANNIDSLSFERLDKLEQITQQTMFQQPIRQLCTSAPLCDKKGDLSLQQFDLGCGAPWGCGE